MVTALREETEVILLLPGVYPCTPIRSHITNWNILACEVVTKLYIREYTLVLPTYICDSGAWGGVVFKALRY